MKETLNTASVENYCGRKPDEAACLFTAPGQVKIFGGSTWTEILLERRTRGMVSGKIWGPGAGDRAAGVLWAITGIIEKWRLWEGLTLGMRTFSQVAMVKGDGKKKRWHRPLGRLRWKRLFPAPTAMEERVGRILEGIRCGVRVCPNTPGYEQLLQNQRTMRSRLGKWLKIYFWNWGRIDGKQKQIY